MTLAKSRHFMCVYVSMLSRVFTMHREGEQKPLSKLSSSNFWVDQASLLFQVLFFSSTWLSRTDAYNFKTPGQRQATIFWWQRGTFLNGAIDSILGLWGCDTGTFTVNKGPTWG